MTNIFICSDLHIDFHRDLGKSLVNNLCNKDIDIIVVAGDISESADIEHGISLLCDKYKKVIYISGNHDYYRSNFDAVDKHMSKLVSNFSNLTWLNNDRVTIDGINFIGGTLWYNDRRNGRQNKHYMPDFSCIQNCDPDAFNKCDETIKYFKNNIQPGDIVITHHMPSNKCIDIKYINSPINCFFATDVEDIILNNRPSIWISGHTHCNYDFTIGKTNLICNPFGYPGENSGFKNDLVLSI